MKRILKWIGIIFIGLIGLVVLVGAALYLRGQAKMDAVYSIPHELDSVAVESLSPGRGEFLASALSRCNGCHGSNYAGLVFVDNALIGTIAAPNLTPGRGGIGVGYSDADWEHAIRHGVGRDGRASVIMPAQFLTAYSDEDLHALIAHLRTVPAVDNELPETSLGPVALILIGTGIFKPPALLMDHGATHTAVTASEVTAGYGKYLANIASCGECHGAALTGSEGPGPPPGPDLSRAGPLGSWSLGDFIKTIRTGTTPDNRVLDPLIMPWPGYSRMSDRELEAIWLYLETLP